MVKRTNEIKVRLTDEELDGINKMAKRSCYARELYIRTIINGLIPQPNPPPEYHAMMNELRRIGVNLNQIAQRARVLCVVDFRRYEDAYNLFKTKLLEIVHFVCLPRKIGNLPINRSPSTKTLYSERTEPMKTRTNAIKIRLTDKELETINKRAKMSGYAREAYIRSLIEGNIPRPIPPFDYFAMMNELPTIGSNLNNIAQKAHVLGVVDAVRYDNTVQMFIDALQKIEEQMLLPEKTKIQK